MKNGQSEETVIVTGAATGIGYAVAERFLRKGARVVLNGRTQSKLEAAARRLGNPNRLATVVGDITETAFADELVGASLERFGTVDVLVNNAGIFYTKPFTEYAPDELDEFLGCLRGTFVLTQSAVRQMRVQGTGGAIINISTILALNGVAAFPSSAPMAAKGGITALTRNLSFELAADGIRINAVAPGLVPTPLYGELTPEQLDAMRLMQPLGRYGTPRDIADAVVYLAHAKWVTGVILPVDGGVEASGDASTRRVCARG